MAERDAAFLGRGWAFPVVPDREGRIRFVEGEDAIEEAIQMFLKHYRRPLSKMGRKSISRR